MLSIHLRLGLPSGLFPSGKAYLVKFDTYASAQHLLVQCPQTSTAGAIFSAIYIQLHPNILHMEHGTYFFSSVWLEWNRVHYY
jgi:hypothetical protein